MKKLLCTFLLGLFIASAIANTQQVRIMTYNMPQTKTGILAWNDRYPYIQKYLKTIQPDLIGMQEPVRIELLNLLSGMPNYSMLGKGRDDGYESGEYSPIMYRTDRFYVEHTGTYWLSTTPEKVSRNWNSACYRIATWAIFRDKATQARFLYTNTHLDHKSDSARTHQMEVIKQQMQIIMNKYGDMPAMLTGDFNVYSKTAGAYVAATTYLSTMNDAWNIAQTKEGDGVTFPSSPDVGTSTERKIDFIMLTPQIKVSKAVTQRTEEVVGEVLSDHRPHWAEISWTTTEAEDNAYKLCEGQKLYDSFFVYDKGTSKLITNATDGASDCQITHDGAEKNEGSYVKYLIDGNQETYFHSMGSTMPPNQPHYLQIDLKRTDLNSFYFTYLRRNNDNYGKADRWQDVMITASNDASTWDYITELYNFGSDAFTTFLSNAIVMPKPYRYVRFSIMHTPAMKIRNSSPQFSCAEFQMYPGIVNTTQSKYYADAYIAQLTNTMHEKLSIATEAQKAGNLTQAQMDEYLEALRILNLNLNSLSMLKASLDSAKTILNTFTIGERMGEVNAEVYNQYQETLNEVSKYTTTTIYYATADSLIKVINHAKAQFISQQNTYKKDAWYYIQLNTQLNKDALQNSALYATSEGTLMNGLTQEGTFTATQNPYAMWRVVDMENNAIALQNRATGFYLGKTKSNGFTISETPVALAIALVGVENFRISTAEDSNNYIMALADSTISQSDAEETATIAWNLNAVDDETIGTVKLPVTNHHIQLMTLPYALQIKPSEEVTTYTLVRMPKTGVFQLRKKNDFEAGEPFFILTGKANELDAKSTDVVEMDILPPNSFTTEAKTINGVHGVLASVNPNKTLYYISDNSLRMARVSVAANTGYIIRTEIKDLGGLANVAYSNADGIVEIVNIGDINDDANINASDLTTLVSMIMTSTTVNGNKTTQSADINEDGQINAIDLTLLVNKIMGE